MNSSDSSTAPCCWHFWSREAFTPMQHRQAQERLKQQRRDLALRKQEEP